MIYETAFVVRPDASEEAVASVKNALAEAFKEHGAEVLVTDTWGVKTFAQPAESGLKKGAYHYFMYKGAGKLNAEIERRFLIKFSCTFVHERRLPLFHVQRCRKT